MIARARALPGSEGGGFVAAFALVWILGVLVPITALLLFSFLRTRGVTVLLEPSLAGWAEAFRGFRLEILLRSLRICLVVTLLELVLAFPFALWLAKGLRQGWLKLALLVLLVVPFFLSPAARSVVWRSILGREGLINGLLVHLGVIDQPLDWLLFSEFAVHLGLIGPYFPSMLWPIYISVALIDDELIKASRDLGATEWQTLTLVILPLALPGIAAGFIFTLVPMLGDNVVAALLGGGKVLLAAEAVNDLVRALNYAGAAALSTLILLAVVLLQWLFWAALRRVGGGGDPFAAMRT
jgi:ABC-type spermidine/putrescine transport system permease subunit I